MSRSAGVARSLTMERRGCGARSFFWLCGAVCEGEDEGFVAEGDEERGDGFSGVDGLGGFDEIAAGVQDFAGFESDFERVVEAMTRVKLPVAEKLEQRTEPMTG